MRPAVGRTRRCAPALVLLVLLAAATSGRAQVRASDPPAVRPGPVAVIVAADWDGLEAIDLAELRALYLGRRTRWEGRRVHPFGLPPGHPARAAFSRDVLGRSEEALDRFWIEQALLGGALPPREAATPAEMVRAVRTTPGAIGYLPLAGLAASGSDGVRVLGIRASDALHRPGDAGYPITIEGP